jgi:hypothetical protein
VVDSTKPRKLTNDEYFKIAHQQIEHEDDLINHRVTWLILGEAIFFASYFQVMVSTGDTAMRSHAWLLIVLGIAMCMVISVSIIAAVANLYTLRHKLTGFYVYEDFPIPNVTSTKQLQVIRLAGLFTPLTLPFVILVVWILLLVVRW